MKNENKITFAILKEKISPDNLLAMAELIAVSETKYLIGYMGARMQKLNTDLYIDIMHKNDVNHTLSNAYDLVQECGLFLCQHFGKYLKDIIGYTKKGKPINILKAKTRYFKIIYNFKGAIFQKCSILRCIIRKGVRILRLKEISMAKSECKNCRKNFDEANECICPSCGAVICPACASTLNGLCPYCFTPLGFIN